MPFRWMNVACEKATLWRLVGAACSGFLLFAAFPPLEFAWAGWFSLFPLTVLLIVFPGQGKPWLEGLLFGAVFFFPTLFWVTEVSWIGWLALAALMSLYPAVWVLLMNRFLSGAGDSLHSFRNLARAFCGAGCWVGLEWLRGLLLTGFTWNFLGVSQFRMVAVIQVAEWGGVLLVSMAVAFLSMIFALTLVRVVKEMQRRQKMRPHFEFTLGMLLIGLVLLYGIHVLFQNEEPEGEIGVLAVQPDIPQSPWGSAVPVEEAIARMEVLSISGLNSEGAQGREVELVVWPETPVGEEMYSTPWFKQSLRSLTREREVSLLMGSIVYAGPDLYNAAMLFPAGGSPPQIYYKNHLVLMGETVPLPSWFPFLDRLVPLGQNFSRGTSAPVLMLRDGAVRMAPLICFEDTFGRIARRFADQRPNLLINITNDGWFGRSVQSRQHLANATFRAVENRLPLLRVSNNGVTAWIDAKGILRPGSMLGEVGNSSLHDPGTLAATIPLPAPRETLYQRFGDWPGVLGILAMVIAAGWPWKGFPGKRGKGKPLIHTNSH